MARRNLSQEDIALDRLPKAPLNRESLRQTLALVRYIRPYRARFFSGLATLFVSASLRLAFPLLPTTLPVTLLSRRPDVAASEHRLAAANAQVGVATANFFPSFTLNATGSLVSNGLDNLLEWEKRTWSAGAGLSLPIFSGGQQTAALAQAKARYQELVAGYRSTVLGAFRDIEDQLSDLDLLAAKARSLEETLVNARELSRLTAIQYDQGLATYLQIIDANQTLLTNQLAAAQAQSQRLAATVLLIKAMGGGWQNPDTTAKP